MRVRPRHYSLGALRVTNSALAALEGTPTLPSPFQGEGKETNASQRGQRFPLTRLNLAALDFRHPLPQGEREETKNLTPRSKRLTPHHHASHGPPPPLRGGGKRIKIPRSRAARRRSIGRTGSW